MKKVGGLCRTVAGLSLRGEAPYCIKKCFWLACQVFHCPINIYLIFFMLNIQGAGPGTLDHCANTWTHVTARHALTELRAKVKWRTVSHSIPVCAREALEVNLNCNV